MKRRAIAAIPFDDGTATLGAGHAWIDRLPSRRSGRVRARSRFRDYDGRCRAVTRWGATEAEATERLLVALDEQADFPAGAWAGSMRLREAAPVWLADLHAGSLARQLYAAAVRLYVLPALGEVRLAELRPALIDRALGVVRLRNGPQPARAGRRALSCLCADAVRHGALAYNPVRDSRPIPCPRTQVRALTVGEAQDLQARLREDPVARRVDLPDLVAFMLGTGVRIGEAAAVLVAVLDLDAGTVNINATVVRVPGAGLRIQPRTKTLASQRFLSCPSR